MRKTPARNSTQQTTAKQQTVFYNTKESFSIWKGCFNILNTFIHFGANYDESFLGIIINISYFLYLGQEYLIVKYP